MMPTGIVIGSRPARIPAVATSGTVCAAVHRVQRQPALRTVSSLARWRQWTRASSGRPTAPSMLVSAAGDGPAQDHQRLPERKLAHLPGVTLPFGHHGDAAVLELLLEGGRRRPRARRIVELPLGDRGVAGLIHANEPRHLRS